MVEGLRMVRSRSGGPRGNRGRGLLSLGIGQ